MNLLTKTLKRISERFGIVILRKETLKRLMSSSREAKEEHQFHQLIAELVKVLPNNDLSIFDIGCNDGGSTIKYAQHFHWAQFHMFEALQAIQDIAAANIHKNKLEARCTLHRFALSDEPGTTRFFVSNMPTRTDWRKNASDSSSILRPKLHTEVFTDVAFESQVDVQVKRLHDLISTGATPRPNFIHLDVQGAELKVLEGMGEFIEDVHAVWLEVSNVELYEQQPLAPDIAHFMTKMGFTLKLDFVNEVFGDQLWLNPKFAPAHDARRHGGLAGSPLRAGRQ